MNIEFTDRYEALGMLPPDVDTMCSGQCEGTGWFPQHESYDDDATALWKKSHQKRCNPAGWVKAVCKHLLTDWATCWFVIKTGWKCDGWHFVKCPDCNGTGKR